MSGRRPVYSWRYLTPLYSSIAGSIGMLLLGTGSAVAWIIAITLVFGVTLGTASGLFRTFAFVGSIASSAVIGVTFHRGVTDGGRHLIARS